MTKSRRFVGVMAVTIAAAVDCELVVPGDAAFDCMTGADAACPDREYCREAVCVPCEKTDRCDGLDNDCNGVVDDPATACPSGQVCVPAPGQCTVCSGAGCASADGAPTGSDAEPPDGGADVAADASAPALPSPGDLVITEVMFDPSGPQPQTEWFELYNEADAPRLLDGVTIVDGSNRTHTIASNPPVVIPSATYAVLASNRDDAVVAKVPPSAILYAYGSTGTIFLANGSTGGIGLELGSTVLVDVPYGPWLMDVKGASVELRSLGANVEAASGWCVASTPWAAGADDGTPGAASDCR